MLKAIVAIISIYILLAISVLMFQRRLMYYPDRHVPLPKDWQAETMDVVQLKTEDNLTLSAWYQKGHLPRAMIYFHGNAGHLGTRAFQIKKYLKAGFSVLMVSYRGYGGNPGHPTEKGLYRDGRAAISFLQQKGIPAHCLVLFGESLGSGIAVQMAMEYPVAGLILQSPYTSFPEMAKEVYPFLPTFRNLIKDHYDSLSKAPNIKAPALVLYTEGDDVVPASQSKRLYGAISSPKDLIEYQGRDHGEFYQDQMGDDVLEFIASKAKPCLNSSEKEMMP